MSAALRLELPANASAAGDARRALGELLRPLALATGMLDDVRLAVSEACSNVVRHAYHGRDPGLLWIDATVAGGELVILVRDAGVGLTNAAPASHYDGLGMGLGLVVMRTLADRFAVEEPPASGTTVGLMFALRDG
jgi:serine/threonine-protein kinase RsbW